MCAPFAEPALAQPAFVTVSISEKTVLLVDDNETVLDVTSRFLERKGYTVVVSDTPFGVRNLVARHEPSVVILDVQMPALDGVSLARLLRDDGVQRIVFYSAMDESRAASLTAEVGSCHFVPKGNGVRALYEAINEATRS